MSLQLFLWTPEFALTLKIMNSHLRKSRQRYLNWEASDKEGRIRRVLQAFVMAGAPHALGKSPVIMIRYSENYVT